MTDMLAAVAPYMDKQLLLGLLYFYADKGYDVEDALRTVIESTALTLDGQVKPEHLAQIEAMEKKAAPALAEFFDKNEDDEECTYRFKYLPSEAEAMRTSGELSLDTLAAKGIKREVMNAVVKLAYLYYDCCRGKDASELLTLAHSSVGFDLDTDNLNWGKLSTDILACNWQSAISITEYMRKQQNSDVVDEDVFRNVAATTIRSRMWLLHWALFPFFKGGNQFSSTLLNLIFDYRTNYIYKSAIETAAPHYVRYVCAAALLARQRRLSMRQAADMVSGIYEFSDAFTQFVDTIYNKPSFENALALLPELKKTAEDDFFLCGVADELVENARKYIFNRYMATHAVVSITFVAEQLGMDTQDAEVWLANLISETKQRAKIDSVAKEMIVNPQVRSVQNYVFETLELADRRGY